MEEAVGFSHTLYSKEGVLATWQTDGLIGMLVLSGVELSLSWGDVLGWVAWSWVVRGWVAHGLNWLTTKANERDRNWRYKWYSLVLWKKEEQPMQYSLSGNLTIDVGGKQQDVYRTFMDLEGTFDKSLWRRGGKKQITLVLSTTISHSKLRALCLEWIREEGRKPEKRRSGSGLGQKDVKLTTGS